MLIWNVRAFLYYLLFLISVLGADPEHCFGQRIHCYSCDSFYHPECSDPFTRHNQVPKSIPIVECNSHCFKWALKTDDRKRMIRNCSTALSMKMEKYLVCITESRSDYGFLCFCNKDKCNEANDTRNQLAQTLLSTVFLIVHKLLLL
ncbi:unnamed protein product [Dicrocoelium dendriticum]|nr:unnamed protein product [Dicrocoelium dendriticum]